LKTTSDRPVGHVGFWPHGDPNYNARPHRDRLLRRDDDPDLEHREDYYLDRDQPARRRRPDTGKVAIALITAGFVHEELLGDDKSTLVVPGESA